MAKQTPLTTKQQSHLKAALAVLGQADKAALTAVWGDGIAKADWRWLAGQTAVSRQQSHLHLEPDAITTQLAQLEQADPARYRLWHERAAAYLATQLRAGHKEAEDRFLAVFKRLITRLLLDDLERVIEVVDDLADVPLQSAVGQQWGRYFKGVALHRSEQYQAAIALFDALLADPALDPYIKGRTLNSRSICCRLMGQLEEAITGYQASLALWQQLGDASYEGKVLVNLGIVAYELQRYEQAEGYLLQAVEVFTHLHSLPWLAVVQNELGLIYRDQGKWDHALACFDHFIHQRQADDAQEDVGLGLLNKGEVLLFQGQFAAAAASLQAALSKMTRRVYQIDVHLHLGLAYQAQGEWASTQTAFETALALAAAVERREILPHVHYRLADIWHHLGDHQKAHTHLQTAVTVIEDTRAPLQNEALKISLLGRWQQVYEALILHHLAHNQVAEAFTWAERSRARAFADAILTLEADKRPLPLTIVTAADIQAALSPGDMVLCYVTTGVLAQEIPLLQAIAPDNPLRPYLLTPAHTLLFCLTQERLTAHTCPIDPNLFDTLSPRDAVPDRFFDPAVRQRLYAMLVGLIPDLDRVKQLYIVPHGPLHRVPFGALLNPAGRPLTHEAGPSLTYAPSGTLLGHYALQPSPSSPAQKNCLAVGYQGSRSLPYIEAEVQMVVAYLGGRYLTGEGPKKEVIRQTAGRCRYLHFACHGRFNPQHPLDSYLEIGQDESLTAREVMTTWRLQADLVTLSACQTGMSHLLRGDEPMGMIRAFLYAGAQAVLATQWPVDDLATFLLMHYFYEQVQGNDAVDLSQALQRAQCWLRTRTKAAVQDHLQALLPTPADLAHLEAIPFAHPRYWAAFVIVGSGHIIPSTAS